MKRLFTLLFALSILFVLPACGNTSIPASFSSNNSIIGVWHRYIDRVSEQLELEKEELEDYKNSADYDPDDYQEEYDYLYSGECEEYLIDLFGDTAYSDEYITFYQNGWYSGIDKYATSSGDELGTWAQAIGRYNLDSNTLSKQCHVFFDCFDSSSEPMCYILCPETEEASIFQRREEQMGFNKNTLVLDGYAYERYDDSSFLEDSSIIGSWIAVSGAADAWIAEEFTFYSDNTCLRDSNYFGPKYGTWNFTDGTLHISWENYFLICNYAIVDDYLILFNYTFNQGGDFPDYLVFSRYQN